jgi:sarcosine oxidase
MVKRFPAFAPPEDHVGFYEPAAGFLLPERIIETNVALAKCHGAKVMTDCVASWSTADGNSIIVHAGSETSQAKQLILSCGAWMPDLVHHPADVFTVTRQPLAWFEPQQADRLRLGSFPVFAISNRAGGLHYGFPIHDDRGFKCAYHFPAERTDPDQLDRNMRPGEAEAIAAAVNRCIPGACGRLLRHCMCMYTNSPDGHFILDRHPKHENVIFASCCSGHGFKFASVIGEILAQLALDGRTTHPIDFLSIKRFKADGNTRPN